MIDPASYAVLTDLVHRQGRSLLQYIRDAFPWTTPEEQRDLEKVRHLIDEEAESTGKLMRFLYKRRVPPPALGSYAGSFTTINFISFQYLVRLLVDYERRGIADLEARFSGAQDPEARQLALEVLEMKRRHLYALEHLHEEEQAKPLEAAAVHH